MTQKDYPTIDKCNYLYVLVLIILLLMIFEVVCMLMMITCIFLPYKLDRDYPRNFKTKIKVI